MPVRKVTDPALLQQLGSASPSIQNPLFPGQMTAQQQQIQQNSATLPYAAPKAAADASNAATQARVNAATAPAEIAQKAASARQSAAQATTTEQNLATTGGAGAEQAKSGSFYTRAMRANQLYSQGGYDQSGKGQSTIGREALKTLLPDSLVNSYTSKERQAAEALQEDFIRASLRYESGANIPETEIAGQRKIYFPQPGDGPETVKLKEQLRQNAIVGLRVAAGPSAPILDKTAQGPAYAPPPTGPDASLGSSQNGFTDKPDPQGAAFWENAARTGVPYGVALRQMQSDAKARGMQVVTPPPPEGYNKARAYIRQNPNVDYHPFNSIERTPLSTLDTLANAAASSAPGAAAGHFLNAATAGLPERLAGDQGQYFNAVSQQEHPIASTLGDIGGFTAGTIGANKALGSIAPKLGRLGEAISATPGRQSLIADAAFGGTTGAVQTPGNPLLGAGEGILAAGGGNLAGRGLANTLGSLISPTGGKLAPLYEMGVRPSLGQRMGGFPNALEEKLQSIPLLGDAIKGTRDLARDQYQVGLFNDSLGEIGKQVPKGIKPGHSLHAFAQDEFNSAYNQAKLGMVATADTGLASDIGGLQRTVDTLTPDSQKVFNKVWANSVGRRFVGGSLAGDSYKKATSELEKKIASIRNSNSGDGELADALQQAHDAIKASAMRNSSPEAAAAMDATDRGYAKLVRLEEASRKAGEPAEFSPTQYNTAVKTMSGGIRNRSYLRGDALNTDIAAIGTRLGDKVSNSGSFDRYAVPMIALGSGVWNPKIAAALGGLGALNAPGIRGITTGLMAPRGIGARTLADMIRGQSGNVGTLGGALGLSLLPSR